MGRILRQVRMVFDLNKCLGCHTCSMACKTIWTDRNPGQMHMYWNNVESHPGRGYPKDWQASGGGFGGCGSQVLFGSSLSPTDAAYGAAWEYNYDQVLTTDIPLVGGVGTPAAEMVAPAPLPLGAGAYSSNWDEDVGAGTFPNSYYFYLPRICNHCTRPACLDACPRKSIYKRQEDGIVLVDQTRCRGYRHCVKGCPYKKIYWNPEEKVSQKCIFCYPRKADANALKRNFCVNQCSGRIRWVGYADDLNANVHKLVEVWGVAMRLHPEFGTEPNTFYIPPLSPSVSGGTARRIPTDLLAGMFGDSCGQTPAARVARIEQVFATIEAERAKVAAGLGSELVRILTSYSEADRIQL